MSTPIVGVHGIRQYRYYEEAGTPEGASDLLSRVWGTALGAPDAIKVAYYSHLLGKQATPQGPEDDLRWLTPSEQQVLADLATDLGAPAQVSQGTFTVPFRQIGQWIAARYPRVAEGTVVAFCREVNAFLSEKDSPARKAVRDAVADVIRASRPKAVIAHSLGSVVAYETLHHHPDLEIDLLLTIGSPLAMRHVVINRLDTPADPVTGHGLRPPGVARWVNVADKGDLVAATASLADTYDGVTQLPDITIGRVTFHSATAYLAHPQVAALLTPYREGRRGA